jgi:hypothetical protein
MKKHIILLFIISVFIASGCDKLHDWNQPKDPAIEYNSVYPLGGEWWVQYFVDGELAADYSLLFTYNTAADDGREIWISDQGNFWTFTVKTPCDVLNTSFSGDSLISTADYDGAPYDIWVNVKGGKVIKDGGHSTSGVVTDSIYIEFEFEDDPGTIYVAAGTRKTGFLEDEH